MVNNKIVKMSAVSEDPTLHEVLQIRAHGNLFLPLHHFPLCCQQGLPYTNDIWLE